MHFNITKMLPRSRFGLSFHSHKVDLYTNYMQLPTIFLGALFALCVCCLSLGSLQSQDSSSSKSTAKEKSDKLAVEWDEAAQQTELNAIRKKYRVPGLIAGHFSLDGPTQMSVCGKRKHGGKLPLELNDAMHLGSCTKSMTATLIAILVEEGKLNWDSKLGDIFDDDEVVLKSEWATTTMDELLTHRSGAVANPSWSSYSDKDIAPTAHRHNILHWLASQLRPASRVGQYEYSNLGYTIVGHVIEHIRKRSWEEEIQERLFDRLGMTSAGFGSPTQEGSETGAMGHITLAGVLVSTDADNPPALGPAGTVHASMEDWIKYLRLHLLDDPMSAGKLAVGKANWEHLHQPIGNANYAAGWIVADREWAGGTIYMHNGSNTMWYCVVFLAPKQGRGVLAASNIGAVAAPACDEALQLFLRHNPYKPPSDKK